MRNHEKETERDYEKEIENLLRDIEVLELQKSAKETQLQRVQRDRKRDDQKKKATQALDKSIGGSDGVAGVALQRCLKCETDLYPPL